MRVNARYESNSSIYALMPKMYFIISVRMVFVCWNVDLKMLFRRNDTRYAASSACQGIVCLVVLAVLLSKQCIFPYIIWLMREKWGKIFSYSLLQKMFRVCFICIDGMICLIALTNSIRCCTTRHEVCSSWLAMVFLLQTMLFGIDFLVDWFLDDPLLEYFTKWIALLALKKCDNCCAKWNLWCLRQK